MNPFIRLWRILRTSGLGSVYKTIKMRLRRFFSEEAHIVLRYEQGNVGIKLMSGMAYDKYAHLSDVPERDIRQICEAIGDQQAEKMFLLFEQGATFWLIMGEEKIAGYWWSIEGKYLKQWYIPLKDDDVVFFSAVVLPEWRGHSISPAVLIQIIEKRMPENISIYLDVETWNESAIRAWLKAGFVRLGVYPAIGSANTAGSF